MPADGYYTATLVMLDNFFTHLRKRHTVQVFLVAHLNAAKFKTHHGWPVATNILDITAVRLIIPCQAIERIVLMTEHITLLTEGIQSFEQLLGYGFLYLSLLSCGAGYYCQSCQYHC